MSEAVIAAVADAKGVDPLDLDPLYTELDPDALDNLFRPTFGSPPTSMELRFSIDECQVVVHGDGEIVVTPPAQRRETPTAIASSQD